MLFFCCSGDPRHIHWRAPAFPRRRSSDLLFDLWSAERILEPVHPRDGREVNGVRFRASHPVAAGFGGGAPATFRVPPDLGAIDEIGRAHVELHSLIRNSYAFFCLKKNNIIHEYPPSSLSTASIRTA